MPLIHTVLDTDPLPTLECFPFYLPIPLFWSSPLTLPILCKAAFPLLTIPSILRAKNPSLQTCVLSVLSSITPFSIHEAVSLSFLEFFLETVLPFYPFMSFYPCLPLPRHKLPFQQFPLGISLTPLTIHNEISPTLQYQCLHSVELNPSF